MKHPIFLGVFGLIISFASSAQPVIYKVQPDEDKCFNALTEFAAAEKAAEKPESRAFKLPIVVKVNDIPYKWDGAKIWKWETKSKNPETGEEIKDFSVIWEKPDPDKSAPRRKPGDPMEEPSYKTALRKAARNSFITEMYSAAVRAEWTPERARRLTPVAESCVRLNNLNLTVEAGSDGVRSVGAHVTKLKEKLDKFEEEFRAQHGAPSASPAGGAN
jgi:hypothetical protein